MGKRLPLLTILLLGVALVFAGLIVRELTSTPRAPASRPQPAASVAATAPAQAPAPPAPAANYAVVASRNLFSPTRSEAPVAPLTPPPPAPVLPKPNLFGIVLIEGTPVAYLEDPVSKRVARYRVGDSVAGGTVKAIESDTVMLLRPEGQVAVRLHDPTRPRAAAPGTPGAPVPGMPGVPGGPQPLGAMPPQPGQGFPSSVIRRPSIPSVLGRGTQQPTDAHSPQ